MEKDNTLTLDDLKVIKDYHLDMEVLTYNPKYDLEKGFRLADRLYANRKLIDNFKKVYKKNPVETIKELKKLLIEKVILTSNTNLDDAYYRNIVNIGQIDGLIRCYSSDIGEDFASCSNIYNDLLKVIDFMVKDVKKNTYPINKYYKLNFNKKIESYQAQWEKYFKTKSVRNLRTLINKEYYKDNYKSHYKVSDTMEAFKDYLNIEGPKIDAKDLLKRVDGIDENIICKAICDRYVSLITSPFSHGSLENEVNKYDKLLKEADLDYILKNRKVKAIIKQAIIKKALKFNYDKKGKRELKKIFKPYMGLLTKFKLSNKEIILNINDKNIKSEVDKNLTDKEKKYLEKLIKESKIDLTSIKRK